jgi:hypothetical protein
VRLIGCALRRRQEPSHERKSRFLLWQESDALAEHLPRAAEEAFRRGTFVARFCGAKFFQQLFLLLGHVRWRFDQDARDEIAAAPTVEHAHARSAMAQLFARLDAGGDLDLDLVAVDAGQADGAAQSGGSEAHRTVGDQGGPFASVYRVPLHVDEKIKVAARRAAYAGLAFARNTDARAFVDASGNFNRQLALGECPALAVTIATRISDHFA